MKAKSEFERRGRALPPPYQTVISILRSKARVISKASKYRVKV